MENESLLNSKNDIPQICNFNTSDAEIKFIHLNHEHQIEHRFPTCYTQFWIDNKMFSTINKNLEIALLEKWIPQIDVADAILLKRSPRPLTPRLNSKESIYVWKKETAFCAEIISDFLWRILKISTGNNI